MENGGKMELVKIVDLATKGPAMEADLFGHAGQCLKRDALERQAESTAEHG